MAADFHVDLDPEGELFKGRGNGAILANEGILRPEGYGGYKVLGQDGRKRGVLFFPVRPWRGNRSAAMADDTD